ncbi:hypothetical protein F5Y17DRAFT_463714 [Xylariaceae sp. FL0594]|nr:hypothetical protein F5Y17DRAFT_463714 [Xylariaceae sp. FL0594]
MSSFKPTFVLLHGAWHNPRCFRRLIEELERRVRRPVPAFGGRLKASSRLSPSAAKEMLYQDLDADLASDLPPPTESRLGQRMRKRESPALYATRGGGEGPGAD